MRMSGISEGGAGAVSEQLAARARRIQQVSTLAAGLYACYASFVDSFRCFFATPTLAPIPVEIHSERMQGGRR